MDFSPTAKAVAVQQFANILRCVAESCDNDDAQSSEDDNPRKKARKGRFLVGGTIPTDNVRCALIQWSCILLHNWRTETEGQNQIKTYFNNIVAVEDFKDKLND